MMAIERGKEFSSSSCCHVNMQKDMRYLLVVMAASVFSFSHAQNVIGSASSTSQMEEKIVVQDGETVLADSAYYRNANATSATIPASVGKIGRYAFGHCFKLAAINVAEDNPFYKSIDGVVYSKDGKTLVLCPAGRTGNFTVPHHATSIAPYAFYSCKKLNSITLAQGTTEIPDGAFAGCWGLEDVKMPHGLKRIGKRAFDGTIVQQMNFPTTMEYIADSAFVNTSIVEVNLRVTEPFELGDNVFGEIHVTRLNVPAAGLSKFKVHPKWGKFGRITPTHSYWNK